MKSLIEKIFNTKISTSYMFILFGVSALMLTGYFSYAWFTVQGVQKYSVVTGNLNGTVAIGTSSVAINGQGVITYTPTTDSDTITLTITNTNDRTVKNSIYYYNLSDTSIEIGYTSDSPTVPSTTGVSVAQNKTLTYKIKINNAKGKQIKIGSSMGLNNSNLTLPSGTTAFSLLKDPIRGTAEQIIAKANPETLDYNTATDDQKNQMWTFSHETTEQLGATTDYRYIGANPNNYVKFNDELWRIIGVFDVDDGTGKMEKRMKIIRSEYIGNYSWSYVPYEYNDNVWGNSSLHTLLNSGAYYNRTTGWYYNASETTSWVDFTTLGLTTEAKEMIGDAKWYLGGVANLNVLASSDFYGYERGTTTCSGKIASWIGKVVLIYTSDYGYATSGDDTTSRVTCLSKELSNWQSYIDCRNNDWLFKSNDMWTITSTSFDGDYVFYVGNGGSVRHTFESSIKFVLPTVYLKSTINITGGTGSSTDPFILG